jgi:hypothetical protein
VCKFSQLFSLFEGLVLFGEELSATGLCRSKVLLGFKQCLFGGLHLFVLFGKFLFQNVKVAELSLELDAGAEWWGLPPLHGGIRGKLRKSFLSFPDQGMASPEQSHQLGDLAPQLGDLGGVVGRRRGGGGCQLLLAADHFGV